MDTAIINRTQLANSTGLSLSHVSRILSGDRKPSLMVAKRIADKLGITLDEFYLIIYPPVSQN